MQGIPIPSGLIIHVEISNLLVASDAHSVFLSSEIKYTTHTQRAASSWRVHNSPALCYYIFVFYYIVIIIITTRTQSSCMAVRGNTRDCGNYIIIMTVEMPITRHVDGCCYYHHHYHRVRTTGPAAMTVWGEGVRIRTKHTKTKNSSSANPIIIIILWTVYRNQLTPE